MGRFTLKNVHVKDGRLYFRRKVAGKDHYVRLPDADDPDFARAYQDAARTAQRSTPARGTMAALVAAYRASPEFRQIPSPVTRANDSRYLDMIVADHGRRLVRDMKPVHVRRIRDEMQETPGKANNWIRVCRSLMSYAAQNDWRSDNPAVRIKPLRIGEHEPWPADVLHRAIEAAPPMTRLAIILGLCTGARIGDAIRIQHGWHDGRMLQFITSKNRVEVAVPMHPLLLAEIAKLPRRAVTILYDRTGRPIQSTGTLQSRLRDLMRKIGEGGYTFHGLRKNACCYLAELGLNDSVIGALVGMTPHVVRHYTKRSRNLMIAKGIADKVTGGDILSFARGDAPFQKGGRS
jgi:integrase